jgi:hypothetical protein
MTIRDLGEVLNFAFLLFGGRWETRLLLLWVFGFLMVFFFFFCYTLVFFIISHTVGTGISMFAGANIEIGVGGKSKTAFFGR